jgi:hypothetical protein
VKRRENDRGENERGSLLVPLEIRLFPCLGLVVSMRKRLGRPDKAEEREKRDEEEGAEGVAGHSREYRWLGGWNRGKKIGLNTGVLGAQGREWSEVSRC